MAEANLWEFELEFPMTVRGTEYQKLSFRRPKAKDLKKMSSGKKSEVERSFALLADIGQNGFSPEEFEDMDAKDYNALQEQLLEVLGVKKEDSQT